ncbi:MAG: hypothetical protein IID36_06970 [Planctomycetes bacterium]|nr:hypothetical protein [Planctomycetota bacterium]
MKRRLALLVTRFAGFQPRSAAVGGCWHGVCPLGGAKNASVPSSTGCCRSDREGDVDLFDFAALLDCVTGPGEGALPDCATFDLDGDNNVDLVDCGVLQLAFTGGAG